MKSLLRHSWIAALTQASVLCANENMMEAHMDETTPHVIGPYSQAVQAGPFLFISGQLAIDPASNKLSGITIEDQTSQVINNVEAILKVYGLTLKDVVKAEVYLQDMNDFKGMNTVYAERFSHPDKPARQAMQVVRLPLDALVEISCIAYIPTPQN